MLEIHLADDLSEHFINVRAMLGTGLNERTAPYLGQSLQKIQQCQCVTFNKIDFMFSKHYSPCPQQLELHVDALSRPCCPLIKSAPAIKSKFFMCGMFFSATHLLSPIINWSLNSDCFSCRIYTTEIIFVD